MDQSPLHALQTPTSRHRCRLHLGQTAHLAIASPRSHHSSSDLPCGSASTVPSFLPPSIDMLQLDTGHAAIASRWAPAVVTNQHGFLLPGAIAEHDNLTRALLHHLLRLIVSLSRAASRLRRSIAGATDLAVGGPDPIVAASDPSPSAAQHRRLVFPTHCMSSRLPRAEVERRRGFDPTIPLQF